MRAMAARTPFRAALLKTHGENVGHEAGARGASVAGACRLAGA